MKNIRLLQEHKQFYNFFHTVLALIGRWLFWVLYISADIKKAFSLTSQSCCQAHCYKKVNNVLNDSIYISFEQRLTVL